MVDRCDVFISYARGNRATAARVAAALEGQGLKVWWDRDLPAGSEFSSVIETRLAEAQAVVSLWSRESVRSAFVRDESARALRAGKLLPVRIEEVELPLGFGQIHTLDLIDWDGEVDDSAFVAVLDEIHRMQGQRVEPEPRTDTPREGALRGRTLRDGALRGSALRWRPRRFAVAIVLGGGLALLGWGGTTIWERSKADEHFRAGLAHQHAKEPELENARNEFLTALEHRSGHARARFYLARVYVLQGEPGAALEAYRLALKADEAPLDSAQRSEASRQVAAMSVDPTEVAPVARSASLRAPTTPPLRAAGDRSPPEPPSRAAGDRSAPATPPDRPVSAAPSTTDRPATQGGVTAKPADTATDTATDAQPRTPPRSAPPEAVQTLLAARVDEMFGENRERRITATTSLVVDPEAISDAVPLAIAKALAALRTGAASPGDASGIVNTLVLLQSALPGTLQSHRAEIGDLIAATRTSGQTTRAHAARVGELLELAATRKAVAFIQIANEAQRPIATALAARFARFGYDAPGIELVADRAPSRNELRVQGKSDRGFARWIERVLGETAGNAPVVVTLRNANPKVDAYEIWLDRDLCAPAGRSLPACSAA